MTKYKALDEDYKMLIDKFKKISHKGYIQSLSNGFGAIGLTFEKLLNKEVDSTYFPDYYGIEIKCSSRFSRYPLMLFSCAFDGPTYPEINRLINKYGYPDIDFKDKKILQANLNCKTKTSVDNKYLFKLEISDNKLFLVIYDKNDKLIEKKSFIYLDTLYNHLNLKLSKLALIYASIKRQNDNTLFRYYKITIYELISFKRFIKLLEDGTIHVSLSSRIGKSGKFLGKYKNKNLVFNIKKDDIEKLFNNVYTYNHDVKSDTNFQIFDI